MKRHNVTLACAVLAMGMAACETPQIALDQANNGVRLTQNLQAELARYKLSTKLSAERRLKTIQAQEEGAERSATRQSWGAYLTAQSESTDALAAQARIRDANVTYTKFMDDEEKALQELVRRLAAVVKDLPSTNEKLGAVQKALADLGTELSPRERMALVTKFLEDTKAIVDKNIKAAEDAASAPASATSAGSD